MAETGDIAKHDQQDVYQKIFEEISEAIIGVDRECRIVLANRAVENVFGWTPEEVIGQPLEMLIPERFRHVHETHVSRFSRDAKKSKYMGKTSAAVAGLHKDGREISLGTTILRTTARDGTALFVAVLRDISERMRYMREIERLANTDSLTGLYNRRHFLEEMQTWIDEPQRQQQGFWLGILDLDGFKAVNDLYGHRVGDLLLKEVAERISRTLPAGCLFARMGGDEFALVVPGLSASEIEQLGARIVHAVKHVYFIAGSLISVGTSAGFARFPDMARTVQGLMERADFALYHVKKARRGGVGLFSPSCEASIEQKLALEYCLRSSDLENELYLEYQPIVDMRTGAITHFEALARWASPELGNVSPGTFIPVAERCGKIQEITSILFRQALEEAKKWPETVGLSFNLSAQDILSPDSVFRLLRLMLKSGVSPSRVEFEVTETSILTDFEQADQALRSIAACNCRISLDDFGAGYSSYGYIDRLPLNKIKMDRSFVTRLSDNETSVRVIRGIADFAASLDLECVAEGVETEAQLAQIRRVNIPYVQGYVFSRPVPANAIPQMLAARFPLKLAG